MTRRAEGAGELEVYFDPGIEAGEKIIFSRYVHEHRMEKAQDVVRLPHSFCPHCGTPGENRAVAMKRLEEGEQDVVCINREKPVPLWDEMEELFGSEETKRQVALQKQAAVKLDSESRERALVGEVISTVANAGQISREFSVSDHGIDLEIEFKNDTGAATGRKLYLQLKSGDSYLRQRKTNGPEIFTIRKKRHAEYWMSAGIPGFAGDSHVKRRGPLDGGTGLAEARKSDGGQKTVRELRFEGERFDVMSVRRWRERVLEA